MATIKYWDGSQWAYAAIGVQGAGGGSGGYNYVQSSEPGSPSAGETWFDTDTNYGYVYHNSTWEKLSTDIPRVSMNTPSTPQVGDVRWNLIEDPPETVGGTSYTDDDTYAKMKTTVAAGTNVSVVPNDLLQTITINSTASGGGGEGMYNALNAADYGLSTSNSAAANTAALQSCINAAASAQAAMFIPGGYYNVANDCLTPTLESGAERLTIFGEGMHHTVLQMERGTANSYFFDNSSGGPSYFKGGTPTGYGNTLRFVKFIDIGFQGGPVETSLQRGDINEDCFGFRLYGANGASDQSFKFTRCRWQTMAGCWESWGQNNASEIGFTDCKMSHISQYVQVSDNQQALNYFYLNCDVELCWGDMFLWVDSAFNSPGAGGSVGVFGGSWIVQDDGGNSGAVIRVLDGANVTSVMNFYGFRLEIRNFSTVIDGTLGGLLTVNFNGCDFTTIEFSGAIKVIDIKAIQFVGYDRCTFEHNGSYATYVNNGGRLVFNECAVRSTIQSEVTTTGGGVSKAKDCFERWNFSNTIEWSE